jgi:hypothetical protein
MVLLCYGRFILFSGARWKGSNFWDRLNRLQFKNVSLTRFDLVISI